MPTIPELKENLSDIQGNVLRGYRPRFAKYRFYNIRNSTSGKAWLKELLKPKTGDLQDLRITASEIWSKENKPSFTVNIAYSYLGLAALGLPPTVLSTFPEEFQKGMRDRAVKILGDEPKAIGPDASDHDKNFPKNWESEFLPEEDAKKIHVFVLVTADTEELKKRGVACLDKVDANFPEVQLLFSFEGKKRPEPNHNKEHFGYTDGISQPFLEGTEEVFGGRSAYPGQGTPDNNGTWQAFKPGEILLGYEDEFGEVAQVPPHYDLRKNGTYLVLRKLEENVGEFREFLQKTAQTLWPSTYHQDSEHYQALVAAKIMGRWPSGCPMILSDEKDDAALAQNPQENNNFLYQQDPLGQKCPLGAHIRRTNPRDQLLLAPKDIFDEKKGFEYHLNRHRIIRRGLPYGEEYTDGKGDKGDRGVIFMALNASISRQFEFLHSQWINKGEFLGLDKTDRDPFLGKKTDQNAKLTVPGAENPFAPNLQRFVTERGGEYFFYPGLTALRGLSEGAFNHNPTFLTEYAALQSMSHTFKGAVARQELTSQWLIWNAKAMFDELREKEPIFIVPPVPPPPKLPDLKKPPIVIATKYDDVLEILQDKDHVFSVGLYTQKMLLPRGPFILGMEHYTAQYQKELKILKAAVYPQEGDIGQIIYDMVDRLASECMGSIEGTGKLDVIGDLVWPVVLRLNGEFFGVPGPGPGSDLEVFKRWCRDIYTDLFLNLRRDREWERLADVAVAELNRYLDRLIESQRKALKDSPNVPETVLTRLIRMQEGTGDTFENGWEGVRRNIFGLIIGVVETTLKAVPRTIDQLLKRPDRLEEARNAALAYSYNQDPNHFKKYVFEAMRFNPQNHVLFRLAVHDFKLAKGTNRETSIIKAPALVFAGTLGAMFDADKVTNPEEFRLDRPDDNYLFFGHGHHNCLGEYISRIQIPLLIKHVVNLKELRRAAGGDQFNPLDLRPEHFLLEFTNS